MARRCCRWLLLLPLLLGSMSVGWTAPERQNIVVWGVGLGPDTKGDEARIRAFEKKFPQYRVKVLSMGAGAMDPQKLMTAIVGRVPPDVIYQDRFTVSDWASRGAFRALDDLIARDAPTDPSTPTPDKYYPAPWNEASYGGKVYAIPDGSDDRVLYYNTKVFAENADKLRAAGLDPDRPPRTWSEVLAYSKVLTKFRKDGTLERAGFIPNYGNSWLYLYAFQNNSSFLTPDGRTCTLYSEPAEEALKFMIAGYDILGGYAEAQKFQSAQRGNADDPFIIGNVAMKIDGDWIISSLARYGPNLEFKTVPAPVPDDRYYKRGRFKDEKDQFITWIGGFSYAIPAGARNVEGAWEFMKYVASEDGYRIAMAAQRSWEARRGRILVPKIMARKSFNEMNLNDFAPKDPRFADALRTHVSMMPFARIRPATPVAQMLWDQHVRAIEFACLKNLSPKDALKQGQDVVNRELDEIYSADKYPVVDLKVPAIIGTMGAVIGIVLFVAGYKRQRIGLLGRTEARWAYLFLTPWLVGFFVFTLGPMLASLFFSFTQYNVLSDARWVGVKNYQELFHDEQGLLKKAFLNVLYLGGIGIPLGLITGLAIALLLNQAVRGMRYYRTAFYLPSIVPTVATAVLWIFILNADPNRGLINGIWHSTIQAWFGTPPPGWLSVEQWAKPSILLMGLWGAGGGMILWLAGLKSIPTTLYEAANIDGANPRQAFWNITLPQLTPLIFFNTVMGLIGSLQTFEVAYVITGGNGAGPSDSLLTPVYHLFRNGFAYFKMGYASALAWVIFFIALALTATQLLLAKKWVHTEGKL
ncbi:MAG: extracellular solute-binding protein [Armatimonadetes bacterium]|nr:extracellular solute-binding protein [Armatimonadota bacterium]